MIQQFVQLKLIFYFYLLYGLITSIGNLVCHIIGLTMGSFRTY